MLKKITSIVVLLLLCLSFLLPANAPALAATMQKQNTIVLEFSRADSDDIRDLRRGQGKIFQKIGRTIAQLQEQGEVSEHVQPIIIITKKKSSKKGLLD